MRGVAQLDRLHATLHADERQRCHLRRRAQRLRAWPGRRVRLGDATCGSWPTATSSSASPRCCSGIMPGGGGTQRLTRLIGTHKSLVAILEGKPFTPAEALANGAVDDVVPPDRGASPGPPSWPSTSARGPRDRVAAIKRSVYFGGSMSLTDGLHIERTEFLGTGAVQAGSGADARLHGQTPRPPASCRSINPAIPTTQALRSGHACPALGHRQEAEPAMTKPQVLYPPRRVLRIRGSDSCAAWLYLPTGVTSPPVVILGHGLGATREMGWTPSPSDSPRPVSPHWRSPTGISVTRWATPPTAVDQASTGGLGRSHRLRQEPLDLDGTRVAVWGSSFGGGHAITVASVMPNCGRRSPSARSPTAWPRPSAGASRHEGCSHR